MASIGTSPSPACRFWANAAAADDDLNPGVVFRNMPREGEPVGITRHVDVREEQGDRVGVLGEHKDRSIAARRLKSAKTCILQDAGEIHEDEGFIIDGKRIGYCRGFHAVATA